MKMAEFQSCRLRLSQRLPNSFSLKSIIQTDGSKINWLQNTRAHFIHLHHTEWTWKETVMACLEVPSEHLLAKTKENSKNTKPIKSAPAEI
jgi:hypothetical protein